MSRKLDSSRRRVLRGVATGVTAGAVAGCAGRGSDGDGNGTAGDGPGGTDGNGTDDGAGSEDEPVSGGELVYSQQVSPIEFDPIVVNDIYSQQVCSQVFEPLYAYDERTDPVPHLAREEPTVERDGTRYVVELRDGPRFQNGDPVTAEDVRYSLLAPVEEETANAPDVEMIDAVEVVDDRTVQIDLAYGYGPFYTLALTRSVVPESVREADRDAFNLESPVGSGPFEFDDWTEGEFVDLVKWDGYWGDTLPHLNRLRFEPVEESTTRVVSLETGESDVADGITPQTWETVRSADNMSLQSEPGISYYYIAFNCNEGPTADPQVREAIDYAVSMDQAVSNFIEPAGERNYAPVPLPVADSWDFPTDEWADIGHDRDVDRAAELLSDAGVPEDYNFRIIVPPDDLREQIGISVSNGLNEAGYDAEVRRYDWGTFLDTYDTGDEDDYNMYALGWLGGPDPDSYVYNLFHDGQIGATNGTYYENDDLMADIIEARRASDIDERRELYESIIPTVLEDRVHLPSYSLRVSIGVRDYVEDFVAHPRSQYNPRVLSDYNNVWLDQ